MLQLFAQSKGVQVVEIAPGCSFQICHNIIHKWRIIPVVKRVNKGLRRHGLYTAQRARGQCNFPCKIERKGWPWDEKIQGDGPTCMIGVQLLISEDRAMSRRTNMGLKGIVFTNIFPPVQKSAEFKKTSLEVLKDLNKISPSLEVLLEPVEGFESPGVRLHWPLDGGKQSLGGDDMEWILQCHLDRLPFDGHLLKQFWVDEMAISSERMSLPHCLLNRASKDIRQNRVTSGAQWDPGKVGELRTIHLWINRPLMNSPETIKADNRVGQGRGRGDGADIGTKHYESKLPLVHRGPTGINEMGRRRGHGSIHLVDEGCPPPTAIAELQWGEPCLRAFGTGACTAGSISLGPILLPLVGNCVELGKRKAGQDGSGELSPLQVYYYESTVCGCTLMYQDSHHDQDLATGHGAGNNGNVMGHGAPIVSSAEAVNNGNVPP
ncbi:hypothetical protein EDB85DRAFT_1896649 [Lactarius pseudohatsudake]|nr:hypothetical protein EDB85DRAFT_1896649 [Lactarius pseudohatsudake]